MTDNTTRRPNSAATPAEDIVARSDQGRSSVDRARKRSATPFAATVDAAKEHPVAAAAIAAGAAAAVAGAAFGVSKLRGKTKTPK